MARRSRSGGSKAGGIVLFLLGLFVGAGILYLFLKPSAPRERGPSPQPPRGARPPHGPGTARFPRIVSLQITSSPKLRNDTATPRSTLFPYTRLDLGVAVS